MAETTTAETTDGETHRSEFLNGGVVIEENDAPTAEVTHICVGCGDEIETFQIFDDTIEEHLEAKPICDDTTIECRELGREAMEAES
ncbi:hypothetical protein [Halostella litorea]|uniref:hypothetical protein n=1 Tax=Halostella litorea TaxID=2528831 RepID=UPI00109319BA|nr:hypothetical protein [Halostella litorea]